MFTGDAINFIVSCNWDSVLDSVKLNTIYNSKLVLWKHQGVLNVGSLQHLCFITCDLMWWNWPLSRRFTIVDVYNVELLPLAYSTEINQLGLGVVNQLFNQPTWMGRRRSVNNWSTPKERKTNSTNNHRYSWNFYSYQFFTSFEPGFCMSLQIVKWCLTCQNIIVASAV